MHTKSEGCSLGCQHAKLGLKHASLTVFHQRRNQSKIASAAFAARPSRCDRSELRQLRLLLIGLVNCAQQRAERRRARCIPLIGMRVVQCSCTASWEDRSRSQFECEGRALAVAAEGPWWPADQQPSLSAACAHMPFPKRGQQPKPVQQQPPKAAKLPDFEKDVNTLIDTFYKQARH